MDCRLISDNSASSWLVSVCFMILSLINLSVLVQATEVKLTGLYTDADFVPPLWYIVTALTSFQLVSTPHSSINFLNIMAIDIFFHCDRHVFGWIMV